MFDVSKTLIRDLPESMAANLFYCDQDGANSVLLDKVKELRGNVFNVSYKQWLDYGEGGVPRTSKTPNKPYTREKCRRLYDGWIKRLRD